MAEIAKTEAAPQDHPITMLGVVAPIVGWLVPGGGHFLLKKHTRGAVLATCVLSMFGLGLWMQGKVYSPNTGDLLDMLGFLGDVGNGSLYILARIFDWGHGAVELAAADYGTKFIIVAGLLNVISAVDAHHIAIGKKS
ncbi:MAG: hypothetical protein HYX26_01625 [Acidobacteriales bacterium]|nr:hypothetical protein [Terriglobales bacterium]